MHTYLKKFGSTVGTYNWNISKCQLPINQIELPNRFIIFDLPLYANYMFYLIFNFQFLIMYRLSDIQFQL